MFGEASIYKPKYVKGNTLSLDRPTNLNIFLDWLAHIKGYFGQCEMKIDRKNVFYYTLNINCLTNFLRQNHQP